MGGYCIMQKDIGSVMGLYPTPVTVVGTVVEGRVNWLTIAHLGIVSHDTFLISVDKAHAFSNRGIKENKVVSVNLVNQEMLEAADYCGIAKGEQNNKSDVFPYHYGMVENAPIIDIAPLSMACEVTDIYDSGEFNNYILKSKHTYVQEEYLNEKNKVDYEKISPVLFEFQSAKYLSTGKVIAECWTYGKNFRK